VAPAPQRVARRPWEAPGEGANHNLTLRKAPLNFSDLCQYPWR
jgi:hypothetical protein